MARKPGHSPSSTPGLPAKPDLLDQLTIQAGEFIVSLAWRHRHDLLPYVAAVILGFEASYLHGRAPYLWWFAVALGGVAVGSTVALPGFAAVWRKSSWRDRIYAGGCTAGVIGSQAVITWAGPRPLALLALVAVTMTISVRWSWHYRVRSKIQTKRDKRDGPKRDTWVQRWRDRQEAGQLASRFVQHMDDIPGCKGGRLIPPIHRDARGVVLHIERKGYTPGSVEETSVESWLRARPGTVRVEPDRDNAARFWVRVVPVAAQAASLPWPGRESGTVADPALLGRDEKGAEVRLTVYSRDRGAVHVLVAGINGSGKTGAMLALLANLVACRDVEVWISDCKNGMDYESWRDSVGWIAYGPGGVKAMILAARQEVDRRSALARQRGENPWQATPEHPLLALVLDEIGELDDQALEALSSLASQGRAPGILVIAATQQPTEAVLGSTRLRRELPTKLVLRLDADLTNSVLGLRKLGEGWRPDRLPEEAPGSFLLLAAGHDRPNPARLYRIPGPPPVTGITLSATAERYRRPEPKMAEVVPLERPKPAERDAAVLWALEKLGGEAGTGAITERVELSASTVSTALSVLEAQGRVRKLKQGRWRLAGRDEQSA